VYKSEEAAMKYEREYLLKRSGIGAKAEEPKEGQ
jgi:ribosomal protein S24E